MIPVYVQRTVCKRHEFGSGRKGTQIWREGGRHRLCGIYIGSGVEDDNGIWPGLNEVVFLDGYVLPVLNR